MCQWAMACWGSAVHCRVRFVIRWRGELHEWAVQHVYPWGSTDMSSRLTVFAFAVAVAILGAADQPYTDVPFVPTPANVVDAMLDLAGVSPTDILVDLGSGDGRIVIAAAKRFGIQATGV